MEIRTVLDIVVSPRSSKRRIVVAEDGTIRASLSAPPVEGRANAELLSLIAKRLRIPKSSMEIISGEKSRRKRVAIKGISENDARTILRGP